MLRIPCCLCVLVWLCMAGCATLDDDIVSPEPTLASLHFESLTAFETAAVAGVRLTNENPFPLTIDGAVYTVTLNGVPIGKGMSGEALSIPRFSSAVQQVRINVSNLRLTLRAADILRHQHVGYRLSARLYVRGTGGSGGWMRSTTEGEFVLSERERQWLQGGLPGEREEER